MLAVTAAMIACSSVFVFLRMVSRIGIVRRVSLDDYFMVLAWVRERAKSRDSYSFVAY